MSIPLSLSPYFDLVSNDGTITAFEERNHASFVAKIRFAHLHPHFLGFSVDAAILRFNLKSALAQLGCHSTLLHLERHKQDWHASVRLEALSALGESIVSLITIGAKIGKLFVDDSRRLVRDTDYVRRMLGRCNRHSQPLLSLGKSFILEKENGIALAHIPFLSGTVSYKSSIQEALSTIGLALHTANHNHVPLRTLLQLHQQTHPEAPRTLAHNSVLLLKTDPLSIRTLFGRVCAQALPEGATHTSADLIDPNTHESGNLYEFFGKDGVSLHSVPLCFYTLEPYREHVFFADRDTLQECLKKADCTLSDALDQAPDGNISTFLVKGDQLLHLQEDDWCVRPPHWEEFPRLTAPDQQALLMDRHLHAQPETPFLESIENDLITSEGILLSRYFPSPYLKRFLLSQAVRYVLKGIYFEKPSERFGDYFSHEDRSLLLDLANFGIPVYWINRNTHTTLQYAQRPGRNFGMFAPLNLVEDFRNATSIGLYGSTLVAGDAAFERTFTELLLGLEALRKKSSHALLNPQTPLAVVTGGGTGSMEVGNRIAKINHFLSCANLVDFRSLHIHDPYSHINNPYIDIQMTYRIDSLVERQSEFNLDFPIFTTGGIGTDFEYSLEEVRRKVGAIPLTPVLLLGPLTYWKEKITSRFLSNKRSGTITGSEWISNCFYCVESAEAALAIYQNFLNQTLPIGPNHPASELGFVHWK